MTMLQGMKVLLIGMALVTLCAGQDIKPASGLGTASVMQQSPRPELLAVDEQALNTSAISRDDFDGLEKTLTGYQSAFEAMSLPGIYRVWPGLDRKREAAFRGVFKFLQKIPSAPRLDLQCTAPAVADVTVSMDCIEALTYSQKNHKSTTVGPVRISILLKKESNMWVIETMKGL